MSFQVDGDTSTNDTVIALASGLSGSTRISSLNSYEARQLQECLDVVSWEQITSFRFLYGLNVLHRAFKF